MIKQKHNCQFNSADKFELLLINAFQQNVKQRRTSSFKEQTGD